MLRLWLLFLSPLSHSFNPPHSLWRFGTASPSFAQPHETLGFPGELWSSDEPVSLGGRPSGLSSRVVFLEIMSAGRRAHVQPALCSPGQPQGLKGGKLNLASCITTRALVKGRVTGGVPRGEIAELGEESHPPPL